ncbi:MAG: tripartite tricarboxylate transporter substrate binding protein [Burkholderiales bacterium]|nr:tripartite tricarboxylate transporter substrate binding protein [Burkholderiales bacterium]
MTFRTLIAGVALAFLALPAVAQTYPTRPIKLVNGFAAGGSSDIVARLIAQKLSVQLGQEVVVETRTGAGGIPANEFVNKAPADGYTLLIITGGYPTQAAMLKSLPYDPIAGFTFISTLTFYPFVFVTSPAAPQQSAPDFIKAARERPGKLSFASAGIGTLHHLSAELFNSLAGTDALHVPFRGGTGPISEIMAGRIDAMFETMTVTLPQVKAGKLKALAVTSKERSAFLPDVPTLGQYLPGFEVSSFLGLGGPPGMPRPVVERINAEVRKALADPDTSRRFADLGGEARGGTPEDMRAYVESEIGKWRRLVEARRIERQ